MQLFSILDIMNAYLNRYSNKNYKTKSLILAYNNKSGSRNGAWVVEYSNSIQKEKCKLRRLKV